MVKSCTLGKVGAGGGPFGGAVGVDILVAVSPFLLSDRSSICSDSIDFNNSPNKSCDDLLGTYNPSQLSVLDI